MCVCVCVCACVREREKERQREREIIKIIIWLLAVVAAAGKTEQVRVSAVETDMRGK